MASKPWTTEEDAFLRANRAGLTTTQLSGLLRRSKAAVIVRITRTGLAKEFSKAKRAWTTEEIAVMREGFMEPRAVAEKLGRTINAVRLKISELGLRPRSDRVVRPWTTEELEQLRRLAATKSHAHLAMAIGRSRNAVRLKMKELGLKHLTEMVSLKEAERMTGYAHTQLRRAKKGLSQRWVRYGHRFVISKGQLSELCEWLKWEGMDRVA